jgi:hypothetical protein
VAGTCRTRHLAVRVGRREKLELSVRSRGEHVFYRTSRRGRMRGAARHLASGGSNVRSVRHSGRSGSSDCSSCTRAWFGPMGRMWSVRRLGLCPRASRSNAAAWGWVRSRTLKSARSARCVQIAGIAGRSGQGRGCRERRSHRP